MAGAMSFMNAQSAPGKPEGVLILACSPCSPREFCRGSGNVSCTCEWSAVYLCMFGVTTSDDYRPVAWIGRYPLRVTSILCGLFVLGMFATTLAGNLVWILDVFGLHYSSFIHGYLWQPLTAPLIQTANFFFLFNVLFFYWSGDQVEQLLGIKRYLQLLGLLLLVPVVILCAYGLLGIPGMYYTSYQLMIGMFIAFAAIYPDLQVFGWVDLKWLAFAGIVLASMAYLSPIRDWVNLTIVYAMCATSFAFIRYLQGRLPAAPLPKFNWFRRKPKIYVVQKATSRRTVEPEDVSSAIDPILDKISKSGIGSLTDAERRQLDRARRQLLKKSE